MSEHTERLEAVVRLSERIVQIDDLGALLDQLLLEARRYTKADAGSIYLVEAGQLQFAYVQNDSLRHLGHGLSRLLDSTLPINESSIAGYVASRGEIISIPDVDNPPAETPWRFNSCFDQQTGYRTRSMVAAPLRKGRGTVVGVLQLLNKGDAVGDTNGRSKGFGNEDLLYLRAFGNIASGAIERTMITQHLDALLRCSESVVQIEDPDALLDQLLHEARRYTGADAGSIYLVEEGRLRFAHVQNDSLHQLTHDFNRHLYANIILPIDDSSIAGYVANREETLSVRDVYDPPADAPWRFNSSFDEQAGYRTHSMVAAPLRKKGGALIGVLQLMNKNAASTVTVGRSEEFNVEDLLYLRHFRNIISFAVERTLISRQTFMRMLSTAQLRDPNETGAHVKRVGAYSVELYDGWARRHGIDEADIRTFKGPLRIAAMMHDVGKVAISDSILKKPDKLTRNEFQTMKEHTVLGAKLFNDGGSTLDRMSHQVVIGHHEWWDGTGYPNGLKGEEIPLVARIVAIADVYDALISRRVYKEAWREQDVDNHLREQAGKQFDPELIDVFFSDQAVFRAIRERFPE